MKKFKLIESNIYIVLILRLLVVMFVFQLSRLVFYLFNMELFREITLGGGLKIMYGGLFFDLPAMLYTNVIFILVMLTPFKFRHNNTYQKVTKWIFIIMNSVAILANLMDSVYYKYTFKRTTAMVFEEFKNETNLWKIALNATLENWYLLLIGIGLIALMTTLYNSIKIKQRTDIKAIIYYPTSLLLLVIGLGLFVIGVRGGIGTARPITISIASDYVTNIGEEAIVLNTPFTIFRTLGEKKLVEYCYFDEKNLQTIYNPVHNPTTTVEAMRKQNVFILILEGFGREYVGALNRDNNIDNYKGYTPFLDSLIEESMYFTNAFANGKASVEAMPSVLSSIPSFTEAFVFSSYCQTNYSSLNLILEKEGYETIFYHGAPNGSMGFSALANKMGINNYIGKDEYNNESDFDGYWGIWDEPFMQFAAKDISNYKEPFIASLFSLTSHHPYSVPQEYEGVFDKGDLKIHEVVGYTDHAVRKFFETAKKQSWYENTLFIITADHTHEAGYEQYNTIHGRFSVPIIYFTPSGELKGKKTVTTQHIDIMPTVLDYLSYNKPYFSFGKSVLHNDIEDDFAITYFSNAYNIFYKNYMLIFDGEKSTALYNYKIDYKLTENLIEKEKQILEIVERQGKAFIQSYNSSLINNKMTL